MMMVVVKRGRAVVGIAVAVVVVVVPLAQSWNGRSRNVLVPTLKQARPTANTNKTKEREREDHNQITSEKETLHHDPPRICRHDNNNTNDNQSFETLTSTTGSNVGCRLTQSLVKNPQPRTRGDVCCVAAARATTLYFCSDKHKRAAATQCLAVERKMSSFLVVLVGVCVRSCMCVVKELSLFHAIYSF